MTAQQQCPACGAANGPRARFCHVCGRALGEPISQPPVEGAIAGARQIRIQGEALDLRELVNVVESSVRWWRASLDSGDSVTRARAAQAIEELSEILHSLSQQLARGQETVQITRRLPTLRPAAVGCPSCGRPNRAGAKFCLGCGTALSGPPRLPSAGNQPMQLRFTIGARTHPGRARPTNQDTVYAGALALSDGATAYLCIVADGMGGHSSGERASQLAAEAARKRVQHHAGRAMPEDDQAWQMLLRVAAQEANRRVYDDSRAESSRRGMGTTLTIALVARGRLHIASVGDSRAYLLNRAGVADDGLSAAQLTSDHSLVARLVDIGQLTPEEARSHPQRNLLYRAIGTDPAVEIDTRSEQLEPGDAVLICSDGLVNYVSDEELSRIVLGQRDPDAACDELVALANQRGGRDNITVVIVYAGAGDP